MMKMVPASRLVSEASLEPPSKRPGSPRSRDIAPAGGTGADCVSITATSKPQHPPQDRGELSGYQLFVKIRLGGKAVIPGHAAARTRNLKISGSCHRAAPCADPLPSPE